ncbi:HAD family hydrolase [Baekduia sp.]|jgi:D-glycero-D-manno-heptose 1,7-bisphosphate phosphatase|uniref:D-glycero-alpha-D-manno-heptose-1,7-bisphosphate 7-phosphatase n=1 Tax=Baekduia sp. TaxID=2600305 RepID=UPI002DF767A3|nr:HAD family hydrolase [Baekduia sp.]
MSGASTRAVFLDRDGVLNDPVFDPADGRCESPLHAADVVLADGAVEGCRLLQNAGFFLIVVSNQPGAAKGKTTLDELWAIHERVVALLAEHDILIEEWRYCHHHPEATVAELRGPCDCRKPAPGMLLDAATARGIDLPASWMVGDSDGDIEAGRRAGCRTVLIEHPGSAHRRIGIPRPDAVVRNLYAGATFITA